MKQYHVQTNSEEETLQLAEALATRLTPGDVVTLEGNLGAGKTMFTKGIARGLGVTRTVNSPTFTMIKEYVGDIPLYHMDVYRLEHSDEDIGLTDYFDSDGISVIEWAQFIADDLPDEYLNIQITSTDEHRRTIELQPYGARYARMAAELVES